jgi:hypothetical protein
MNEDVLKAAMIRYERANAQAWATRSEEKACTDLIEKCLARERGAWTRAVKSITDKRRRGWSNVATQVYYSIHHEKRPFDGHIVCKVRLLFCAGCKRGNIELYGDWNERDDILRELERVIM